MSHMIPRRQPSGTKGAPYSATTNSFVITKLPSKDFYHYDVVEPEVIISRRLTEIIDRLQTRTRPDLFQPRAAFDGRRNLFSSHELRIPDGSARYAVNMSNREPQPGAPPRGIYNVRISKVAIIKPGDLQAVIDGRAHTSQSLTALQLLNILVRQAAIQKYPHNARSFYTESERADLGALEIWRGYFQSVRPSPGRMLINVDISTSLMYRRGPLVELVLVYLNIRDIRALEGLHEGHREWSRLKNFLKNVRVTVTVPPASIRTMPIKGLEARAGRFGFMRDNEHLTVEQYYKRVKNVTLRYPHIPGICTGKDAVIPFELCEVVPGQFFKKKVSPSDTTSVLKFSTKGPQDRLHAIKNGLDVLDYEHSDFIRQADMQISTIPLEVKGRILSPPTMSYGNAQLTPSNGAWNVVGRQFSSPGNIKAWSIICFEPRIPQTAIQQLAGNLIKCFQGLEVRDQYPPIISANGQQNIDTQLTTAGQEAMAAFGARSPTFILAILPFPAPEIRKAVKQFGDIIKGVATQIMKADNIRKANNQYCNNLAMKINVKIGGVNAFPMNGDGMEWFRSRPSMVVGADVTHPGPGVLRPSVVGLVSSVDENASKYVADCRVQEPRHEIITDLTPLMINALQLFHDYQDATHKRNVWPAQIVFFRDGVSEGELHQVADTEFKQITEAISLLWDKRKLNPASKPKVTFIVVGKRHHVRFFPNNARDADRSGNCHAGFVVDNGITNPIIFDYYLQSHSGLLGTSRPSHYIVVQNDNNLKADTLQALSYALCHVYARATRSVSIPAPVYYADIVCARADFHFQTDLNFSDDGSTTSGPFDMDMWRRGFKAANPQMARQMYFM